MPFTKGDPNINRKGRIDGGGGLKAYDREKFRNWSDEERDAFLETLSPEVRYKMAEGNPATSSDVDIKVEGELPILVKFLDADKNNRDTD